VRLLALDCCLDACQAAAVADGVLLAEASEAMTRGHQERLAPMAGQVMSAAGLAFAELDAVAVTVGPGSFTGLRVGLAFAKGLALALEIPCIGVGTLAALAASVEAGGRRAAVVANGRGEAWLQRFDGGTALGPPETAATEALASAGLIVGPTATSLAAPGQAAIDLAWPSPLAVALRAATHPEPASPLYLRAPDARARSAKVGAGFAIRTHSES
jgi:tRNA threonylcarbamoyladenosine biosynthesis protein TsaB